MGFKDFLKECHARSLFKLLSVYIVSGWVIIQVFSVINEPLNIPKEVITYVILLLLICLPIYMFILWRVRLKDSKFNNEESVISNIQGEIKFKRNYFISIALIALISFFSAAIIYDNSLGTFSKNVIIEDSNKIAVLDFKNNTGNPELDVIGSMSSDWLIHGLTEYSAGDVISPETMESYASLMGVKFNPDLGGKIFDKILRPNKLITGSYFKLDGQLVFNCVIQDVINNTVLIAFPQVKCDEENAVSCIEEIKQDVLGYLEQDPDKKLSLEQIPPKFEAYKKKLLADKNYDNSDIYINLLDESIALDSSYFEPQVLRVQYYYNKEMYKVSDSLNQILASNPKLTDRQRTLLQFCEALIEGKNDRIYTKFKYEYNITPYHLETNSTAMVLQVQFINKPELAEKTFNVEPLKSLIDELGSDIDNCVHCKYRYYMMGTAYNSLGDYSKTLALLKPLLNNVDDKTIDYTYLDALINLNKTGQINRFLKKRALKIDGEKLMDYYGFIGEKYLIQEQPKLYESYFNKILENNASSSTQKLDAHFYLRDYDAVERKSRDLSFEDKNKVGVLSKIAVAQYKNGNVKAAERTLKELSGLETEYGYGNVDYALGQYYASIGKDEQALDALLKSISKGNVYLNDNFKNDPILQDVTKRPEFNDILTFWH